MKIKFGTKVEKTDKGFVFDVSHANRGKITSRVLPDLLGKNSFTTVGEAILERFGFLEKGHFEEWYSVRGRVGELLANEYIKAFLKHKGIEYKKIHAYELNMFKGFDMFHPSYKHGHEVFGGTPDMLVEKEDRKENMLIEVKTKNISNYNYIVSQDGAPETETLQAHYLGYMTKSKEYALIYVFMTDEQETMLKKITPMASNLTDELLMEKLGFNIKNTVIRMSIREVDRDLISNKMKKAESILDDFEETGLLPYELLEKADIVAIEEYIEKSEEDITENMFETF